MAKYNIKRLRSYIEKAIADACKSENRPNDVTFDAFIIDNAALLLILHCKYLRVQRRVYYRILNNVPKHFGLSIVDLYKVVDVPVPDYVAEEGYVEAGMTVADVKVGKTHYFIWPTRIGKCVDKVHEMLRDGVSVAGRSLGTSWSRLVGRCSIPVTLILLMSTTALITRRRLGRMRLLLAWFACDDRITVRVVHC